MLTAIFGRHTVGEHTIDAILKMITKDDSMLSHWSVDSVHTRNPRFKDAHTGMKRRLDVKTDAMIDQLDKPRGYSYKSTYK